MTRIAHCRQTAWLPNDRWNRRLTPVCRRALVKQTLPDLLRLTRFSRAQEGFEYGDPVQDFTQRRGERKTVADACGECLQLGGQHVEARGLRHLWSTGRAMLAVRAGISRNVCIGWPSTSAKPSVP